MYFTIYVDDIIIACEDLSYELRIKICSEKTLI